MLTTALLLVLSQAPLKIAAPNFSAVNVPDKTASFVLQSLSEQLASRGLNVLTAREIEQIIGLERQRQLLGCSDDAATACATEMAGALGVDGILIGDLARLGAKYQLTLKVIRSTDGHRIAGSIQTASSEEQLPELVERAAQELASATLTGLGRTVPPPPATPAGSARLWVPVGLGAAFEVAAVIAFGFASAAHSELLSTDTTMPLSASAALATRDRIGMGQTLGWVGVATGAALVGIGIVLWLAVGAR